MRRRGIQVILRRRMTSQFEAFFLHTKQQNTESTLFSSTILNSHQEPDAYLSAVCPLFLPSQLCSLEIAKRASR
jgi:hypothetical protein